MAITLNPNPTFAGNIRRALEEFSWNPKKGIVWEVFLRLNGWYRLVVGLVAAAAVCVFTHTMWWWLYQTAFRCSATLR